jgi:hypothetical protein
MPLSDCIRDMIISNLEYHTSCFSPCISAATRAFALSFTGSYLLPLIVLIYLARLRVVIQESPGLGRYLLVRSQQISNPLDIKQ